MHIHHNTHTLMYVRLLELSSNLNLLSKPLLDARTCEHSINLVNNFNALLCSFKERTKHISTKGLTY